MLHEEQSLLKELVLLRTEHQELDHVLKDAADIDQLSLQRIKKRKLFLKDRINFIESIIYPDIIA